MTIRVFVVGSGGSRRPEGRDESRVIEELLSRMRATHGFHMAEPMIRNNRSLLWAAASAVRAASSSPPPDGAPRSPLAIDRWPEDTPSIEESVREFIPTAICFKRVPWAPRFEVVSDRDHCFHPQFVSALYIVEATRTIESTLAKTELARAFLAPPALFTETDRRAELLASTGKGVPLPTQAADGPGLLTGRLTPEEIRRGRTETLDEQLALVPVLAARGGPVALLSPRGDWPRSDLARRVADRLGTRIHRLSLENIPSRVLRQMRHVRYDSVIDPDAGGSLARPILP